MIRILEKLRGIAIAETRARAAEATLLRALDRVAELEAALAKVQHAHVQTSTALEVALRGSSMGARLRRSVAEYLDGPLTLGGLSAALMAYDAELVDVVRYRPKAKA